MDLGLHTGARLGTIGFSNYVDFYIHVIFGPAGGSVTLIG